MRASSSLAPGTKYNMKKITLFLLFFAVNIFSLFGSVYAQAQDGVFEAINSFDSSIVVNTDSSINVTETIKYNTSTERRGIFRDIKPLSSQNRKMKISDISVTDEKGFPYQFETSKFNGFIRIKIGDPDQFFTGEKTYVIKYRATDAVGQTESSDEIYWNVTGSEWPMPIFGASASVTLPSGASSTQSACYFGPEGSTNSCGSGSFVDGAYVFDLKD